MLGRLGVARPPLVLSVAGTNGKGSCVALLEALATGVGRVTGAYTSPHLGRYNERIRLDGAPADDARILDAFRRIEAVRGEIPLTYFEYGTLAALAVFERARVEVALLEVGLGGRLDAVNALDADAVLVTNVALDHQDWLGGDREAIGREKAGVMRADRPAVIGEAAPPATLLAEAARLGADLRLAGRDFIAEPRVGGRWDWRGRGLALEGLPLPALAGAHQLDNAAAALALAEAAGADDWLAADNVRRALERVVLPGRLQVVPGATEWVFDVAHNPAAAAALARHLAASPRPGRSIAVAGLLADKDAAGFAAALAGEIDTWIAVPLEGPAASHRARSALALAAEIAAASGRPCEFVDAPEIGLARARALAGAGDRVVVCGSFHLVGPALEWHAIYSRHR